VAPLLASSWHTEWLPPIHAENYRGKKSSFFSFRFFQFFLSLFSQSGATLQTKQAELRQKIFLWEEDTPTQEKTIFMLHLGTWKTTLLEKLFART
jgi:hypothetical protein